MSQSSIILDTMLSCRGSFKKAMEVPRLRKDEWAKGRFADFNLWAAGAGAAARGKGSLDARLAGDPEARDVVVNLLRMLEVLIRTSIEKARGADDTNGKQYPNEVTEVFFLHEQDQTVKLQSKLSSEEIKAMEDVESILNQIIRVTIAIRKAGSHARRHKADGTFDPGNLSPGLRLFRKHLEIIVLARPSPDGSPHTRLLQGSVVFVHCAQEDMGSPSLDTPQLSKIQSRLIEANLRRRNRFLYSQSHDEKLADSTKTNTEDRSSRPRQHEPRLKPEGTVSTRRHEVEIDIEPEPSESAPKSTTTASAAEGPIPLAENRTTGTSMTGVTSTSSRITYPKAPIIQGNRSTFKCPCCCQTLAKEFAQGNKWKKHLVADVLPYTCILDDCPSETELYLSRQSWVDHMNKDHSSKRHWICFACIQANPRPSFDEESEFTTHIKQKHQPSIKSSQIPTLVSAWSRSVPTHIEACPLCPVQGGNAAHLLDHIAQEVHAFSLRSLPWGPKSLPLNSSESGADSEDDGNYKTHFKDNQYFGDGSERTNSQDAATSSSRSSGEGGLPPLDYREEDALSTSQSSHPKLTEDAMASVQSIAGDSVKQLALGYWISETLPLAEDGTDSDIGLGDDSGQSKKSLKNQLEEARVPARHRHSFFFPISSQNELVTVSAVVRDIQAQEPETTKVDAVLLANTICASARRLYATLVCNKMGAMIRSFIKEGITDRDLPFVSKSTSGAGFTLHRTNGGAIKTLNGVSGERLRKFDRMQWWVLAPVFKYGEHYELDDRTILPFMHFDPTLDRDKRRLGASSKVYPVNIHPAHHDFWESSTSKENQELVAVKQLSSPNEKEFLQEFAILKALRPNNDPHTIKLLATYKYTGRFHLMFRYADSNLREYWNDRPMPKFDRTTVLWSLKQICGISRAVSLIHIVKVTALSDRQLSLRHNKKECFWRHGDIQADNILWFKEASALRENLGVLQLSGFHIAGFHSVDSEHVNPDMVLRTQTYSAPECTLRRPVSRAYDIWSLGCLYLEFLTWLLRGSAEVEEFADFRGQTRENGIINDDDFFTITTDPSGAKTASVRDKVIVWTDQLHKDEKCSALIHDLLDLIMGSLLIIEARERIDAARLYQVLLNYQKRAADDEDYLLKPTPRN